MFTSWIRHGPPSSQDYCGFRKRIAKDPEFASVNIIEKRKFQEASLLNEMASTPPGLQHSMLRKKLSSRVRRLFMDRTDDLTSSLVTEITQALLSRPSCDIVQMLLSDRVFNKQVCSTIDSIQTVLRNHEMQRIETRITSSNDPSVLAQSPWPSWFEPPIVKSRIRSRQHTRICQYSYQLKDSLTLSSGQHKIPVIWTVGVKKYLPQGV